SVAKRKQVVVASPGQTPGKPICGEPPTPSTTAKHFRSHKVSGSTLPNRPGTQSKDAGTELIRWDGPPHCVGILPTGLICSLGVSQDPWLRRRNSIDHPFMD